VFSTRRRRTFRSASADQEEAIPLVTREQADEVALRDDQFRLKDAVGQRGHHTERDRLAARSRDDEVFADASVKRVGQRVEIANDGHGPILERTVEQQPRILPLVVGGGE
jgi:hypothetical protein